MSTSYYSIASAPAKKDDAGQTKRFQDRSDAIGDLQPRLLPASTLPSFALIAAEHVLGQRLYHSYKQNCVVHGK